MPPVSPSRSHIRRAAVPAAVVAVLTALVAGVLVVGAPAAAAGAQARSDRYEHAVEARLNRLREARGLRPVVVVPCVDGVAETRAALVRRTQRTGRPAPTVLARECGRTAALEAVAVGRFRPAALVRSWMEDDDARRVLLRRSTWRIGLGAAFGRARGWHVDLLVAGRRVAGGGSVPVEEAAPTPPPAHESGTTDAPDAAKPTDPATSTERADTELDPSATGMSELEQAILAETNRRRAAHGLSPLEASTCAADFAGQHSATMAGTGVFAHADLGELLEVCPARGAAENIAYGWGTALDAATVVQLWMDSPGHRANILAPGLTHLGVGVAVDPGGRWYATQDFLQTG